MKLGLLLPNQGVVFGATTVPELLELAEQAEGIDHQIGWGKSNAGLETLCQIRGRNSLAAHLPGIVANAEHDQIFEFHLPCLSVRRSPGSLDAEVFPVNGKSIIGCYLYATPQNSIQMNS